MYVIENEDDVEEALEILKNSNINKLLIISQTTYSLEKFNEIEKRVKKGNVKLIEIQRSRGYALRKSISLDKVERVIKAIREVDKDVIIMIDNCYCEFVSKREPLEVGADVIVGSLIKNLGGGIAPNSIVWTMSTLSASNLGSTL